MSDTSRNAPLVLRTAVESTDVVTPTHVSDQHAESLDVIFLRKNVQGSMFFRQVL